MNVRRFLYVGATVAAGALCATVAAAASKYTLRFDDSSTLIFRAGDGTKTAVPLGSGECIGSVGKTTLLQSDCNFSPSPSPTNIGGVDVFTSWSSCDGSGTASPNGEGTTLAMSQAFALRVTASDGTFDCSTACGMKVSTKGDLGADGSGRLNFASPSPSPGAVFTDSPACSPDAKAALEASLSAIVGADFGVTLATF